MEANHDTILVVAQYSAGPYLGGTVIRGLVDILPTSNVIVSYVPINRIMSDVEYRNAVQSVERVIMSSKPRSIISMDDDYLKYMSPDVQAIYDKKFVTLYKADTVQDNPTCAMIERIMQRTYMMDSPVYVLRDENSFHAEAARTLVMCLRGRGHEVDFERAGNLSDLRSVLLQLSKKPRGFLVSYMGTIEDTEFNTFLDQDGINDIIADSNKKHIDISLVRGNKNLSIVLIPRVVGLKVTGDVVHIDQVVPQLYINPQRLHRLDADLVYKNMFSDVAGVIQ